MAKLTVRDLDAKGKEVLMRVDFNVPLKDGEITNDARIVAALPTIKFLLDQGARLVLTSHLGRPKNEPDPAFSLKPVAARLSELLGKEVKFVPAAIGPESEAARAAMKDGDVVLLENVRFYPGEKKNDPEFAKALLGNATLFVNDAFGTAHRAHASTEGVTHFAEKSAMGFLIERELEYLEGKLENPEKPFVVIMGGAKVSDKIEVLSKLMEKADTFLIGGAMANTFLAAEGYDLGASKIEGDKLDLAREILAEAKAKGVKFLLPADVRVAMKFEDGAETFCTAPFAEGGKVPEGGMAIDIGAKCIVVSSLSGRTVRMVSRFRVPVDIIGMATNERVWYRLALSWGVQPVLCEETFTSTDVLFYNALRAAKKAMHLQPGDNVVMTGGNTTGTSGNTNLIKVETI